MGDYTPLTVGNFKRMDGVVDWIQNRLTMLDSVVARPFGRENTPGPVLVNKAVDKTQWWLWETYRFGGTGHRRIFRRKGAELDPRRGGQGRSTTSGCSPLKS